MTRRAGGAAGATVAVSTGVSATVSVAGTEGDATVGVAAGGAGMVAEAVVVAPVAGATSTGAGGAGITGFGATGAVATGGGAATTERAGGAWGGGIVPAGGRAMTGPTGGLLAIAGGGAGATIFACWRGSGTMRRGAGEPGCADGVGVAAGWADATAFGGVVTADVDAGGAATTNAGRAGGAALMAASACLRSRIALSASPGLETLDRSNFGLLSAAGLFELAERPPALK
jgi:hypothetical protein